jgi:hypothetical protein
MRIQREQESGGREREEEREGAREGGRESDAIRHIPGTDKNVDADELTGTDWVKEILDDAAPASAVADAEDES